MRCEHRAQRIKGTMDKDTMGKGPSGKSIHFTKGKVGRGHSGQQQQWTKVIVDNGYRLQGTKGAVSKRQSVKRAQSVCDKQYFGPKYKYIQVDIYAKYKYI